MKKTMLLSAALFICEGLFALFSAPRLVSPELNANSITFRFRAPKTVRVELNWEYTVHNVTPDFIHV
jgi:hypothetical protein